MERLQEAIRAGEDVEGIPELASHVPWAHEILDRHPELVPGVDPEVGRQVIQDEIGQVFARVLEDCGVFKDDAAGNAAFVRFVRSMGGRELT